MNDSKMQSFVAILVALFLGATGFSSLNNLNSLNQLQQTVAGLSASVLHQPIPASTDVVATTESDKQASVSSELTPTERQVTQSQTNTHDLRFGSMDSLLLFWDTKTVSVPLFSSSTVTNTKVQLQLLIAQDEQKKALNFGYHSEKATITPTVATTQTVELQFKSIPPTGTYFALLMATNGNMLTTQSVTLIVVNRGAMTLHQDLTTIINDKIVISGGRWWPILTENCTLGKLCQYSWNEYKFLLPQRYLDSHKYILRVSELSDPTNGRSANLVITRDMDMDFNDTPVLIKLRPIGITYPGAYTGTFSITDLDNSSVEVIPIIVRARVYSWAALIVILLASLVAGWVVLDPIKKQKRTLFVTAVLIATMTGISYIENRLPTFGNSTDYYAALGWAFSGSITGTSALAVIMSLVNNKNSTDKRSDGSAAYNSGSNHNGVRNGESDIRDNEQRQSMLLDN